MDTPDTIEVEAARSDVPLPEYETRGARAAVFRPRFGQAHQQYFTPAWLAGAMASIAEALFDVHETKRKLAVLDPTAGSGRLLAPFSRRGHLPLGVELDDRLVSVARRAAGKDAVRAGDICEYAPYLEDKGFQVAAMNPPYGLWWPVGGDESPLAEYELASAENIESQCLALELARRALQPYDGLLLALMSGRFWQTHPHAAQYLRENFQVIAVLSLPKPFEKEYGIEVDASLVVAITVGRYTEKERAPLVGASEGDDAGALVAKVIAAFKELRRDRSLVSYNYAGVLPDVPHLDMAVSVAADSVPVHLTPKGLRPAGEWPGAWLAYYGALPLPAYNAAEGTLSDAVSATAALPNILMPGVEAALERLTSFGLDVLISPESRARLEALRARYARDRLPLRELAPMEYLAWFNDGPITTKADARIPGAGAGGADVAVQAGAVYQLRVRWERRAEAVGPGELKGEGKKTYVLREYVDRGFLVFRFQPEGSGAPFTVREIDAAQVKGMLDAFGLPEVKTVEDLAEIAAWRARVERVMDAQAATNGERRLYPIQADDVARMATKPHVALLYEQGGGKSPTIAHWAAARGYRRVLVVAPASVVPGWLELLTQWGFAAQRLDHAAVTSIRNEKRRGEKPRGTRFFVCSYEDLCLGDVAYEPWSHDHFDNQGNLKETAGPLYGAACPCGATREQVIGACPKCGVRGREWSGRACRACGYVAYSEGALLVVRAKIHTVKEDESLVGIAKQHGVSVEQLVEWNGVPMGKSLTPGTRLVVQPEQIVKANHHAPLGPRVRSLFSCVVLDEAQDAKSKLSLRGMAARSLRARGKALLSGTLIKGFVTDLYFTVGWLLGFGSPLWPFPFRGGSARFLAQFGTFKFVTREFADTLQKGQRRLIPSVSNLGRLWRLLSPVAVRRLKEDFLRELPPKRRHLHFLPMSGEHEMIYRRVEEAMSDLLERELRKEQRGQQINMGVISMALWWGRFAASCPNAYGGPHYAGAFGQPVDMESATPDEIAAVVDVLRLNQAVLPPEAAFNKVEKALELLKEIRAAGEKALVFTSLRGLYRTLAEAMSRERIAFVGLDGVPTRRRNMVAREFERGDATVLLAGTMTLNRGVTIVGANHVLILNLEWSPEVTLQAEDRVHRPGQSRTVHVHYLLSQGSLDEQMWGLIGQKAAAQRAVLDREAPNRDVAALMDEAVGAKLRVAKAFLERPRPAHAPLPAQPSPARPGFGAVRVAPKPAVRKQPQPVLATQLSLFGAE